MKWLVLFLLGAVPMLWYGYTIYVERDEAAERLKSFCDATHGGESWPHVQERAARAGLSFVRANASTSKEEEWLAIKDAFTFRYGCRVTVVKGLVVKTSAGELPAE